MTTATTTTTTASPITGLNLFKDKIFYHVLDTSREMATREGLTRPPFILHGKADVDVDGKATTFFTLHFAVVKTFNKENIDPYWTYMYIGCKPVYIEIKGEIRLARESEWWYSIGYGAGVYSTPFRSNPLHIEDLVKPTKIPGDKIKEFIHDQMPQIIKKYKNGIVLDDGESFAC